MPSVESALGRLLSATRASGQRRNRNRECRILSQLREVCVLQVPLELFGQNRSPKCAKSCRTHQLRPRAFFVADLVTVRCTVRSGSETLQATLQNQEIQSAPPLPNCKPPEGIRFY